MKKVLLLDGRFPNPDLPYSSKLEELVREQGVLVMDEAECGNQNSYGATPEFLDNLQKITKDNQFDLIIIGNYIGAGFTKAMRVNRKQRDKIVIVTHLGMPDELTEAYRCLEITRHHYRTQLASALRPLLEL